MASKILIFLAGGFLFLLINFVFNEKKEEEKISDLQIVFESAWQGGFKEAENFLPKFHSQLMKIAKTGAIKKRTVSRKISRVEKKIKNLKK